MSQTLIYVHDPMCSWCWGYAPTWLKLKAALKDKLTIQYKVGGLAPDSDTPMEQGMQDMLKATWEKISNQLGTQFNYDFWRHCQPRRSTYPACRAALIARKYAKETEMISAIQQAYYLNAKNPSDNDTLIALASQIGLNEADFSSQLLSPEVDKALQEELMFIHSLPIQGFPSLVLIRNNEAIPIAINYTDWRSTFTEITALLEQ